MVWWTRSISSTSTLVSCPLMWFIFAILEFSSLHTEGFLHSCRILRTVAPVSSSFRLQHIWLWLSPGCVLYPRDSSLRTTFNSSSSSSSSSFHQQSGTAWPTHAVVSLQNVRSERTEMLSEAHACQAMWQPRKNEVSLSPFPRAWILTMELPTRAADVFPSRLCAGTCVCVSAWVCACEGGVRKTIVSSHWLKRHSVQLCAGCRQPIRKSSDARFMNETACMRGTHSESEKTQWCNTIA